MTIRSVKGQIAKWTYRQVVRNIFRSGKQELQAVLCVCPPKRKENQKPVQTEVPASGEGLGEAVNWQKHTTITHNLPLLLPGF